MTSSGGGRDCGTAVWNTGDVCVCWIVCIGDTLSSITCGGCIFNKPIFIKIKLRL